MSDFQITDRRNTKSLLALVLLVLFVIVVALFTVPLLRDGSTAKEPTAEEAPLGPPGDLSLADVLPLPEQDILAAVGVSRAFAVEYGGLDWRESKADYHERLSPLATDQLMAVLPGRPTENDRFLAATREKSVFTVTTGAESIRSLSPTSMIVVVPLLTELSGSEENAVREDSSVSLTLVPSPDEGSTWLVDDVQHADAGNLGEAPDSEG